MKGKDIEESITLKLIVSPFVGVYVFFVVRGGCELFSVSLISWEQRKFSDLYQKNDERNNGQFGWNKTISTSTMTFNEIGNGAADSSIDNYKVLRIGDIAFEGHTNKEFRYGRFVLNDIGDGIMSPRFATLRPIIKQDFSFWKHYIHNERIMRKKLVRSTKAGTMMNELVIDDLMEQLILVPSLQEQKKIGAFFGGLNHLITLHQSKLFEHNKKKTCQFMISWEQCKLGETFTLLQNNTLSRAELNEEKGVAKNVHYGDVLIKLSECLDLSKESLPFIEQQSVVDKFKNASLQNGDVVVADTAEDETVGKSTEIMGITDEKVISGLHTIPLRPIQQFSTGYLGYYFNSPSYHDQLKPHMQGIKVTSISKGAILGTVIKFPSDLKEQEQIGRFFLGLDHLITLHQRKLSYYRNRSILYGSF